MVLRKHVNFNDTLFPQHNSFFEKFEKKKKKKNSIF